jgi:hypothetical protein
MTDLKTKLLEADGDKLKKLIAGAVFSGMGMARQSQETGGSLMVDGELASDADYAKALADRVLSALEGEE